MKSLIVFISFLFLNSFLFAQKEFDKYLKTASENNPGLKSAFSEYNAALEVLPQEKALPDPNVMFQYFTTPLMLQMGSERFALSASQMFPWFGQRSSMEQAVAEMAKAKYETFISKRNELFYEIKSVYFQFYVHHQTIHKMEETIKLLNSMREMAKIKFESGKESFVNVLRADMEIAEMENELTYNKDLGSPLNAEFEKLLNTKNFSMISFPDTLWQDSISIIKPSLIDSVAKNNPDLKKMDYEISNLEKQMEVAKKSGYPSFSLGATYINMSKRETTEPLANNGKDMFMFPEIGVTVPLYRKKYNAMINEAKYKSESATFEKAEKTNELTEQTETTYRDYLKAKREIILYTRLFDLANNARELLLSSFSTAGTDFDEVLQMQKQQLQYSIKLEEARALLNTTVAYMNYLTGKQ